MSLEGLGTRTLRGLEQSEMRYYRGDSRQWDASLFLTTPDVTRIRKGQNLGSPNHNKPDLATRPQQAGTRSYPPRVADRQ